MENLPFVVAKSDLQKGFQKVSSAVNGKNSLPIYDYFLCELKGEILHITGSDTSLQIQTEVPISFNDDTEVYHERSFCIETTILSALKTLPEQPITLIVNLTGNNATLVHSSGDLVFPLLQSDGYTKLKEVEGDEFVVPADRLRTGFEVNIKQMADDELRPVMNGVFVDIQPNCITFVASDGHRMSKYSDFSMSNIESKPFLLPSVAVNSIIKIINTADDDKATINVSSTNVTLRIGNTTLTARQIEGKYPNYNSVIPTDNSIKMEVDCKALTSIVNRVLVVSNSNTKLIKIDAQGDKVIISAADEAESKSAKEETDFICDGTITIGAKGTYLLDLFSVLHGNAIFSFSDSSRAMLISPEVQGEDTELILLLMPLMLN